MKPQVRGGFSFTSTTHKGSGLAKRRLRAISVVFAGQRGGPDSPGRAGDAVPGECAEKFPDLARCRWGAARPASGMFCAYSSARINYSARYIVDCICGDCPEAMGSKLCGSRSSLRRGNAFPSVTGTTWMRIATTDRCPVDCSLPAAVQRVHEAVMTFRQGCARSTFRCSGLPGSKPGQCQADGNTCERRIRYHLLHLKLPLALSALMRLRSLVFLAPRRWAYARCL